MTDSKRAKGMLDEIEYWKQLLDDQMKNINDVNTINDAMMPLILAATTITMSYAAGSSIPKETVEELTNSFEPIQTRLQELLDRVMETTKLAEGRLKMLRAEFDAS